MPAIGGTDPADLEAKARAELGFSQQLEQSRRVAPPPPVLAAAADILCGNERFSLRNFTRGRQLRSLLHPSIDGMCAALMI
jgi:hypothetical protein